MKQFFRTIFINREQQVRSGWKVGLVMVLYIICMGVWLIFFPAKITDPGYNVIDTLMFGGIIGFVLRWLDHKRLNDIGLTDVRLHFRDLGFGLIFGMLSMAAIFVVLAVSGQIEIEKMNFSANVWASLGNGLLLFTLVGFREELFSRGYCLFAFGQMRRTWLAVLLSTLLFTLLHGANPNLQPIGLLNIFLAGSLFSWMTVKTGNLWMAIGYHITWNFSQGSIFGFPVSGHPITGIFQIQLQYHNLLTGGSFGPEAGILATGTILAGFLIVWFYAKDRPISDGPFYNPSLKPLPAKEPVGKYEEYC